MKKITIVVLLLSGILFTTCKKDQITIRSANQQSSNDLKLDTAFQFALSGSLFNPINWIQKDFYIPMLDSVANPDLKVYRTLSTPASTSWQEVYLDSARALSAN